ncbi:MAG: hypothetical protein ACRCSN_15785 [Dermatophilaceae bacterium]
MTTTVATSAAHRLLCSPYHRLAREGVAHPGDLYGKVLGWLWTSGQENRAIMLIVDLVGELRHHNPYVPEDDRVAFSTVLAYLPLALPGDMNERFVQTLVNRAKAEVPKFFGQDDLESA